jgi:hypothetical protein
MGAQGTDLYYASLAADHLVFVRRNAGLPGKLGIATVSMP